ncbi:GNAT family N-acetyltransferase [Aquirufa antheringensis]
MLNCRKANINDILIYFDWVNDAYVRQQSYNSQAIDFAIHQKWFESAINNVNYFMLIFQNNLGNNIGQVRIQKQDNSEAIISISIDASHRGKGYAKEMLGISTNIFLVENSNYLINAYIKNKNLASKVSFEQAGFRLKGRLIYENEHSFHYIKYNYENR